MLHNLLWPCFIIRLFSTKLFKRFSPSLSGYWNPLQICSAMCGFVHCAGMEKISDFAVGSLSLAHGQWDKFFACSPKKSRRRSTFLTCLYVLPVDSNKRSQASQIRFSKDSGVSVYFSYMYCARYESDSMSLHESPVSWKNTSYLNQQRCNFEAKQTWN